MSVPHVGLLRITARCRALLGLLACLALLSPGVARAEGSGTVYPDTIDSTSRRANIEWRSSSYGPDLLRRTLLRVFANKDEYILLASSAVASSPTSRGDILIYGMDNPISGEIGAEVVPASASFSCRAQRSQTGSAQQGRITSRAQELAGPDAISDAAGGIPAGSVVNGFVPCYYRAPETGIYAVVFYGPLGNNRNNEPDVTGQIGDVPGNINDTQGTSVAMWDVTVRTALDDATTTRTGRLFTYYIAANTGGNGRPVHSSLYVVTNDGFRYRISSNGHDPFGWLSYANQVGFLDGDEPLYHNVMALPTLTTQEQNQLEQLQGSVTLAEPQYPMFIDAPSDEALQFLGLPTQPVVPRVEDLVFRGPTGSNVTLEGVGGTFSFETTVSGVYQLVISRDGVNFDAANPDNRTISGVVEAPGTITVNWDGRDEKGATFPIGDNYRARMDIHGGEVHFPALDIENSVKGGPAIELLNPPGPDCFAFNGRCTGAFYDDRGYQTSDGTLVGTGINQPLCANNTGAPPAVLFSPAGIGYDSSGTSRAYGFARGGNSVTTVCAADGGFGDKKGLDKWTYYPSNVIFAPFRIIGPAAVTLSSFSARPAEGGVEVRWTTAAEVNTLGFHVLRSDNDSREGARQLTTTLISARGRVNHGASYTWTDTTAVPGRAYRYWLQETELSGRKNVYGPVTPSGSTSAMGVRMYLPVVGR